MSEQEMIIITPKNRVFRDSPITLESLRERIEGDLETIKLGSFLRGYINDNGIAEQLTPNLIATVYWYQISPWMRGTGQIIRGNLVITSKFPHGTDLATVDVDNFDGEDYSCSEDLWNHLQYLRDLAQSQKLDMIS